MAAITDISINPRLISAAVERPAMRDLSKAVRKRFRVSNERARGFAERLLTHAVKRFGIKYLNDMAGHIEHAFRLRDEAAGVLDQVIGPEALSAEAAATKLEGLFRDIKSDMEAITDPVTYAKQQPKAIPEPTDIEFRREWEDEPARGRRSSSALGKHTEQTELLSKAFKTMAQKERKAMRRAAEVAPRELWRAVASETQQGLERNIVALAARAKSEGMSRAEVDALSEAVRTMSLERARSQRVPGTAEAALRTVAVRTLVPKLEALLGRDAALRRRYGLEGLSPGRLREHLAELGRMITGDRYLELLASENPAALLDFFESSGARSRTALRGYIRGRMVTHIRGLAGEFTAAFQLGEQGLILIKGPDYDVTIPGTDLVGVTRNGRIWLIDNKALSDSELESVSSLVRNIRENLADDAAAAARDIGRKRDPLIGDAVARLDRATKEIQKVTRRWSPKEIGALSVQKQITAICDRNGIDRVVTNAGGAVQGLSGGLQRAGILIEDLNAGGGQGTATP